mmetsp:Transcript_22101/g.32942  ORF Transcript_22101/g.32942 Transcript_22101/m.32942 type:complete len:857 (+) Transcript_22101:71-2641(+)
MDDNIQLKEVKENVDSDLKENGNLDSMEDASVNLRLGNSVDLWYIPENNKVYLYWWTVIGIASMVSAVLSPLAMAFLPGTKDAEIFMDVFFYLDIIFTFFVVDTSSHFFTKLEMSGESRWKRQAKIFKQYLKGWLIPDILSILPFERMNIDGEYAPLLRLFRLIRIRRVVPLVREMEKSEYFNYYATAIIKYVIMAAYNAHWSACIFYELARIHDFDDTTWVSNNSPGLQDESIANQYVTSLYWAITTLTTVGYGDISPSNNDERAWVMIYMLLNLGMTSYIIGNITALMSRPESETMQFREHLDHVREFMKREAVPGQLRHQVLQFIKQQNSLKFQDGQEILNELPTAIRIPIQGHRYFKIFKNVDIFDGLSKEFTDRILGHMKIEMFMKGMKIIKAGDFGSAFYIIKKGDCEIILKSGETIKTSALIKEGGHFGSEGYFASIPQPFTIMARTTCVLIKIRESFKAELSALLQQDIRVVLGNLLLRLGRLSRIIERGLRMKKGTQSKSCKGPKMGQSLNNIRDQSLWDVHSRRKLPESTLGNRNMSTVNHTNSTGVNAYASKAEEETPLSPKLRPKIEKKISLSSDKKMDTSVYGDIDSSVHGRMSTTKSFGSRRSHLYVEEYWNPFFEKTMNAIEGIKAFKARFEHDVAASLCQMASAGNDEQLRLVLNGRDLSEDTGDYDSRVPLHLAAANGHLEVCKVLTEYKADPSHRDHSGRTPILEAVEAGHKGIIKFLLQRGGEICLNNPGEYFCNAAFSGNQTRIELLCVAKADLNASDYDRRTALHLAAAEGNEYICKVLVKNKADIEQKDRWGSTAIDSARVAGHNNVLRLFEHVQQQQDVKMIEVKEDAKHGEN